MKEALESQEIPFNEHAWEQMSSRLDKVLPVQKNGLPWKSILGVSAIVVTCAAIYFTQEKVAHPVHTVNPTPSEAVAERNLSTEHLGTTVEISPSENTFISKNDKSSVELTQANGNAVKPEIQSNVNLSQQLTVQPVSLINIERKTEYCPILLTPQKQEAAFVKEDNHKEKYSFALNPIYCENQSIQIDNPYGQVFKLVSENETVHIPMKGSASLKNLKSGSYAIYLGNDKIQTFEVQSVEKSNKVNIIEDYHFVQGVPQISVLPATQNDIHSWYVNGAKMSGSNYTFNAFNKGDYEVTFITNTVIGCPTEYSTKIHVDQTYNLLAPTAFNVNSMDQRNRTFIPYALTQRDTPFELIIIEPASGRVVYRTTSIQGWDGIDQGTGELIPANKPYVWKVTLAQPLKGEKKEYSSVVTRVN